MSFFQINQNMKHELNLKVTPVFLKNWNAIHLKNDNGERLYRYIINRGSSRSSKTSSIIDCLDMYARTEANKRITAWRDTHTDAVKTILADIKKHLGLSGRWLNGHIFNETKSIATYKRSNTLEIHGTDDVVTVHGLNQSVAWLNEPYKIARAIFDQIDQRTEDFLIFDYNPKEGHWLEDVMKDPRAIVIDSTFLDNPFCPQEQKIKILSYQPVSMCKVVTDKRVGEAAAKNYDVITNELDFTKAEIIELSRCRENENKKSANAFNWSVYGLGIKAEKPNRIFHWEEITDDEYNSLNVTRYYGNDWGSVDPWAIAEIKYYDGGLYIKELNYQSENIIRAKLTPTELQQIGIDDEGLVSWMFNKLGVSKKDVIVCDNSRESKIRALRLAGYDHARPAHKPPGSILDGIDTLNDMRVYYTASSTNVKHEQENYSRKVDNYGIVQEDAEDFDNHHMDSIRYVATYLKMIGVITKI
jgi:phage terminase large subunit